ncbi:MULTISPECIES: hypothetical protein, partial [Burkholderia]|uniref:hypothetical protein n=1 Tax=Burkholderia TaxID=32008 RepID=UPI001CA57BC7
NRTVKRLYADDSADSRVKVGNRQAPSSQKPPPDKAGVFAFRHPEKLDAASHLAAIRSSIRP